MRNWPGFFLKFRSLVWMTLAGIIVLGSIAYLSMPREAFPQIEIPIVVVSTLYRGVAPEDMETLVSKPLEKKLKSLSGIKELSSVSAESFSSVVIEFTPETDIDVALQKVRDKVALAKADMPKDIEEPSVSEISFDDFPVMVVSLSGDYGLNKLKLIADDLKDEFESVPGVLGVNVIGGLEREIQVLVDPARLKAFNISFDQYNQALSLANINLPGGEINLDNISYLIRIPNDYKTVQEIRDTVLYSANGRNVYVKDVAEIKDTYKKITSKARTEGKEAITITVQKRSGANIITLADKIKAIIAKEKKQFPKGTQLEMTLDYSKEIAISLWVFVIRLWWLRSYLCRC